MHSSDDERKALARDDESTALAHDDADTALTRDEEGNALTRDEEGNALTRDDAGTALACDTKGTELARDTKGTALARDDAAAIGERILRRIFAGYGGRLVLRLWDGTVIGFAHDEPLATLVIHDARVVRDLVLFQDPLRLADAYFHGLADVEGDIYEVLALKEHFQNLRLAARDKVMLFSEASRLAYRIKSDEAGAPELEGLPEALRHSHSRAANRRAIAFHYDVSDEFYRLWLDRQMVYSCAYFERPDASLDEAQEAKLDHICRKLRLAPGETLLDIGCGWGALIRWAATHYGVHARGITLSRNQYQHNLAEIERLGLEDSVAVELLDYRDLAGEASYDKIVSVGMFEHVGIKNLPVYFATVHRLLKPGGLFLNHGITHDESGWNKTLATRFINRYVFPGGELDRVSNVQARMEDAHFEILDVEALRAHYALTLRHWVSRLEAAREAALAHVAERVYRVWRLYMAACAVQFEDGGTGVYQILAAKRRPGLPAVPLTRRDLYR